MQLSGNKVRKLEFLLSDAVAQGADCVITVGGIQSNHCRATAVAAKYLNLDCYLILRTSKVIFVLVAEIDRMSCGNAVGLTWFYGDIFSFLWIRTLVWLAISLWRDCWEHTLILSQKKNMEKLAAWYALPHHVFCYCFEFS